MKICKIEGAVCPNNLKICCGTCNQTDCDARCDQNHEDCPDAEIVTNEIVQFQSAVPDTITAVAELMRMKKQLDEREKHLKQKLVEAMETYGVKSFENEQIKVTYVAPTTKTTIDSAKLKKDLPDIVEQYSKTSNVSASVRVTVK